MAQDNDYLNDDGILDIGDGQNDEYVPRLERDLAKLGSLQAVRTAKKTEQQNSDEIDISNIDLSGLKEETYEEEQPEPEIEFEIAEADVPEISVPEVSYEEDTAENDFLVAESGYSEDDVIDFDASAAEEPAEQEIKIEEQPVPKPIKTFADMEREEREAEERERMLYRSDDEKLEELTSSVNVANVLLSDMDYDDKKEKSRSIAKQMQLDDMAMELDNSPKLEEMSTKYTPSKKKNDDLSSKASLDRDEKQLIRERLEKEIGKRPADYDKKKSWQMYKDLMQEKKVKLAKKGFLMLLLVIALGVCDAAIIYKPLNWSEKYLETNLFSYLPIATLVFSVLLFIKAKPFKILSCLYFAANTVILAIPGFFKFMFDTETNAGSETVSKEQVDILTAISAKDIPYFITLAWYIVAIAISVFIFIQLVTSEKIEAYFTTPLIAEKKQVFDEKRSKYRQ